MSAAITVPPVSTLRTPEGAAAAVQAAITLASNSTARSQQAADFIVGMSDLGGCREYVRLMLTETPATDPRSKVEAFIGSALGEAIEEALGFLYGDALRFQIETRTPLPSGRHVRGHPDIVGENIVLDLKSKNGVAVAAKAGMTLQQRFQTHGYGGALVAAGEADPSRLVVGCIYYDRAGVDEPVAHLEPYDPNILQQIDDWLDDVIYAVEHDQRASQDRAREWCASYCEYFTACRGGETDATGLITDEDALAAVEILLEAQEAERVLKRRREAAKATLAGVEGSTGTHTVRWVNIGATDIPGFTRAAHRKINIGKVAKR